MHTPSIRPTPPRSAPLPLLLALAAGLAACTGTAAGPEDSSAATDTGGTAARTFDTCEATVTGDVPTFYTRFFRCVDITMNGADVAMFTTSEPPYDTYYYGPDSPNYAEWDDQDGTTTPNPNVLTAQAVGMVVPAEPVSRGLTIDASLVDLQMGTSSSEYRGGPVGISPDSVSAYNATAAPGDDILEEQFTFDTWGAHPDPHGSYHHHQANRGALSALLHAGLVTTDTPGEAELEVYGIMCDGTVLLGCTELDGSPVDADTLDAQNGHVGEIVDPDGTPYFSGRYHTHLCAALGNYGLAPEIQYYESCGIAPQ